MIFQWIREKLRALYRAWIAKPEPPRPPEPQVVVERTDTGAVVTSTIKADRDIAVAWAVSIFGTGTKDQEGSMPRSGE